MKSSLLKDLKEASEGYLPFNNDLGEARDLSITSFYDILPSIIEGTLAAWNSKKVHPNPKLNFSFIYKGMIPTNNGIFHSIEISKKINNLTYQIYIVALEEEFSVLEKMFVQENLIIIKYSFDLNNEKKLMSYDLMELPYYYIEEFFLF